MSSPQNEGGIDFTRLFMPEHLTPLYHTDLYRGLSDQQRRRYNQLHALYLNEQTIFFESVMARPLLNRLLAGNLSQDIKQGLSIFKNEEAEHTEMFRQLNRRAWPDIYSKGDFYFVRVSRGISVLLRLWINQVHHFPFFLWILLLQEERALFYGKEFLRSTADLEPNFVNAQRRHVLDEVGHVQWDGMLLDLLWPKSGSRWRGLNARLLSWMMREYFTTPKRSGLRVVAELTQEFPSLRKRWRDMRIGLTSVGRNPEFHRLSYSRDVTPRAFVRFDACPALRIVMRSLPAYCAPGTVTLSGARGEKQSAAT